MTCEIIFKTKTPTKTDVYAIVDQSVRDINDRILNKLVSEVGLETIQKVCNQIHESKIHEFLTGVASLSDYEQNINNRIKKTIIEEIIGLNKCSAHPAQIQKWLSEKPIDELIHLRLEGSLTEEDLAPALLQYSEIATKNMQILEQFKEQYGPEIFGAVYEAISESRKTAIEVGCMNLEDYHELLKIECDKKRAIGTLPPKEVLCRFIEEARVTKFESGYNGVFLIEGLYQEKQLTLAVKAPEKPSQEAFGASVMRKLQNKTPEMHVIEKKSDPKIARALHRLLLAHHEYKTETPPACFFVMSYLSGTTLEEFTLSDFSEAPFPEDLFTEIGQMAASDLFLFNRDRLPTIGMGNLANAIILKNQEGKSIGVAAIDTTAYLSNKEPILQIDPIGRIRSLATDIAQGSDKLAQEIFDELFSREASIDREASMKAIQQGLVKGLKAVASLARDDLSSLVVIRATSEHDIVDLEAYNNMLQAIQETTK